MASDVQQTYFGAVSYDLHYGGVMLDADRGDSWLM